MERYNDLNGTHLDILENGEFGDNGIFLVSQTRQSKILMAQASSLKIYLNEDEIKHNPKTVSNKNSVFQEIKIKCFKLQPVRFEKLVSIFTSKDIAISDPLNEAKSRINQLESFSYIYKKHRLAWSPNLEVKKYDC